LYCSIAHLALHYFEYYLKSVLDILLDTVKLATVSILAFRRGKDTQMKVTASDVVTWRQIVRDLWIASCKADGIDPKSQFVVFSDSNRFQKMYNAAMGNYLRLAKRYEDGN